MMNSKKVFKINALASVVGASLFLFLLNLTPTTERVPTSMESEELECQKDSEKSCLEGEKPQDSSP